MAEKFRNKYRTTSFRKPNWDYRWNASYFITICTDDRKHYFGKIEDGEMQLSNVGVIADLLWHGIKNHTKYVELGAFVVMPNHIHGILTLNNPDMDIPDSYYSKLNDCLPFEAVELLHATTRLSPQGKDMQKSRISPKPNSISAIIRSYKSAVTKNTNRMGYKFKWQSLFHDHVIRNKWAFRNISNYIKDNPQNWKEDKFKGSILDKPEN